MKRSTLQTSGYYYLPPLTFAVSWGHIGANRDGPLGPLDNISSAGAQVTEWMSYSGHGLATEADVLLDHFTDVEGRSWPKITGEILAS